MTNLATETLSGMDWGGIGSSLVFWIGWGFVGLIVIAGLFLIYCFIQYNIPANTWSLYGSGKDGVYSVGRKKWNRLKWINKKSAWKPLLPLMNKIELEPFDSEYVYQKKQVYAFILNDKWVPGKINIKKDKDGLETEIKPVPYYIRNWQSLIHKKNAKEFAEHNFWEDNKYFFMVIITAALCLIMVGITIYFTYNFATGGSEAMSNLAESLKNWNSIPGVP